MPEKIEHKHGYGGKRYLAGCRGCQRAVKNYIKRRPIEVSEAHAKANLTYAHRVRRRRRKLLDAIQLAIGCVECGYDENPVALQFDHVRGIKEWTVSSGITRNIYGLLDEIEKCEVVCANCHMVRTHG